jgi:hypothetical protein
MLLDLSGFLIEILCYTGVTFWISETSVRVNSSRIVGIRFTELKPF